MGSRDTIVLKKIGMPSKESLIKDLEKIACEGRARLEGKGLKESDILNMVQRARRG